MLSSVLERNDVSSRSKEGTYLYGTLSDAWQDQFATSEPPGQTPSVLVRISNFPRAHLLVMLPEFQIEARAGWRVC